MRKYSLPRLSSLRNGQTPWATLATIILLILLTLPLAGCQTHPTETATPTQAPNASDESALTLAEQTPTPPTLANGWYLYTDSAGEFSFGYPTDAVISAGQNPQDGSRNILIQFLIPDQPYQGMSIRIEPNPDRLSAADFAAQLYTLSAQQKPAASFTAGLKSLQVGGVSAVQAVIPASNTELTVIAPYEADIFIVSPVHDLAATKVEPETLTLFYQVLDTMAFGVNR